MLPPQIAELNPKLQGLRNTTKNAINKIWVNAEQFYQNYKSKPNFDIQSMARKRTHRWLSVQLDLPVGFSIEELTQEQCESILDICEYSDYLDVRSWYKIQVIKNDVN